jgi:cytochrome c5
MPRSRSPIVTAIVLLTGLGSPILVGACGDDGVPGRRAETRGMNASGGMMRMMGRQSLEVPEGVPASELPAPGSRGARLTARYCSQCHGTPSPRRHTADDWDGTVRRMFRRMDHMARMRGMMRRETMDVEAPTQPEADAILAYLREHAMPGAEPEALPAGEGRDAFRRACSRCHALPDPGQHTPEEWPGVVERMRRNMERMDVEGISDAETSRVVRYLRRAAGGTGAGDG